MKKNLHTSIPVLAVILFISLTACHFTPKASKDNAVDNVDSLNLKQHQEALLGGLSRAVCYSGFRSGQHPDRGEGAKNPSREEIIEDLRLISKDSLFNLIRLYDCGENSESVLQIIQEEQLDIKVMLGIWLRAELSNHEGCAWLTEPIPQEELDANKKLNLLEIEKGIQLANKYPNVVLAVNVGNEALVDWNDHKVHNDTIISYVKRVKHFIKQDVTVAENYEWWAAQGQALANELDFISIHVYPVWEGKDIDEGISYTIANFKKVKDALPEASIVISEAGWASIASEFGERANEDKQARYYNELMQWSEEMNISTFFFEAFDEDWKGDPNNMLGAEKHWGLYTVDRKPKKVISQL